MAELMVLMSATEIGDIDHVMMLSLLWPVLLNNKQAVACLFLSQCLSVNSKEVTLCQKDTAQHM